MHYISETFLCRNRLNVKEGFAISWPEEGLLQGVDVGPETQIIVNNSGHYQGPCLLSIA